MTDIGVLDSHVMDHWLLFSTPHLEQEKKDYKNFKIVPQRVSGRNMQLMMVSFVPLKAILVHFAPKWLKMGIICLQTLDKMMERQIILEIYQIENGGNLLERIRILKRFIALFKT
jgi:hypothetical protein